MSEQNENKATTEEVVDETTVTQEEQQDPQPNSAEGVPSAATISQEVVEVSWEEVQPVYRLREALRGAQQFASNLLMEQEKQRRRVFDNIDGMEKSMYEAAAVLKEELSLHPEWVYEFKLPANPGEKAYFIRKEE